MLARRPARRALCSRRRAGASPTAVRRPKRRRPVVSSIAGPSLAADQLCGGQVGREPPVSQEPDASGVTRPATLALSDARQVAARNAATLSGQA